jgi:hypothetical protein
VKNVAKGEDVIKENTDQTYTFGDEFLEEAMKSASIYEADEDVDVDYEYWSSNHNAHTTLSISNSLHSKCMNLLYLLKKITSVFEMVERILVYYEKDGDFFLFITSEQQM